MKEKYPTNIPHPLSLYYKIYSKYINVYQQIIIMIQNATRHTLTRAKNHLSKMKETFQNDELFESKLSDFVDSARSITFHMQKQYMMKEGFGKKIGDKWDGWYGSKEDEMKNRTYFLTSHLRVSL